MLGIVAEQGFVDKPVDRRERTQRVGGQRLVAHQQQAIGVLAIDCLAQRVQGETVHPGAAAQAFCAGINRAAGIEVENF